jgi:hypothetical protein
MNAPTFNEVIRRQRAHRLAAGKCETKADLQLERRALADELVEARKQIAVIETRAARYAAVAWVCGLVVGIVLGVLAS